MGASHLRPACLESKAKRSRSVENQLSAPANHSRHPARAAQPPGTPQKRCDHPGNTVFRSALSPPPLPVRALRHCLATCCRFPGGAVPVGGRWRVRVVRLSSAFPPARRARPSHGQRRAAIASAGDPPGHQLCRHRLPVLGVPAEGPGRPRAQGQCWS